MKKLLWLDINCSFVHASLALPAIHAQCGEADAGWSVVSATLSAPVGSVVAQIIEQKPDVLTATAWLFTRTYLEEILCRVKTLLPDCRIVLGGPEFLGDNEAYLRSHPEVRAVFRGEGEESFPQWLRLIDTPQVWHTVTGLCFLDDGGVYHDGGLARVMDFARLNPPEESRFFNWTKPFVQLETTRGCFNSCAFCVSGAEKPVRSIPLDAVRKRIENIHAHGIREVRLLDRTFNGETQRAMNMLRIFADFPDMRFHLEMHPAYLPDPVKELLKSLPGGLLHLEAGIQSLREPVLKACRRAGKLEDALDGLRFLCSRDNLETHLDLIVGLPLYTLDQIYEDIHTLASFGAGEIQLELLKLLPGTAMRNDAEALGIVYSPLPPYEVLRTNAADVADIQTGRMLSRLLDMYYNARSWQPITRRMMREESGFLSGFLAWMRRSDRLEQPLSVERRGLLLFEFIMEVYPLHQSAMADAWENAGLSSRKIERFIGKA